MAAGQFSGPIWQRVGTSGVAILADTEVTICSAGTTRIASLYTNRAESAVVENPTKTDANGNLMFFAAVGAYDLYLSGKVVSGALVSGIFVRQVPCCDPLGPSGTEAPLIGTPGSETAGTTAGTSPEVYLTTSRNADVLIVQAGTSMTLGRAIFEVFDALGNPICGVGLTGGFAVFGDHIKASQGVVGPFISLDGTTDPPSVQFPIGNRLWMASGAPSSQTRMTGTSGDYYLRTDTPATANQRIYVCTATGTPGTWSGIL